MKLRYLFAVISLLTACVFPSLALADESQEFKTYRAQCDRGEAEGCYNLGLMYYVGKGVKQSNADALNYFSKACGMKSDKGCKSYALLKMRMLLK